MLALDVQLTDWASDDFPDLIWTAVLAAVYGDDVIDKFKAVQRTVFSQFGALQIDAAGIAIDGRLTSLERIPAEYRPVIVAELSGSGLLDIALPDELLAVLRLYRDVPGAWLLVDPLADRTPAISDDAAVTYLAQAFVKAIEDSHRKALVVFPGLQWLCYRKKISVTPDMATAFDKFPHNLEGQSAADASVRTTAMLMTNGPFAEADHQHDERTWAMSFWHQNWHMTVCQPAELKDAPEAPADEADVGEAATAEYQWLLPAPGEIEELSARVESLFSRFIQAALDNTRDVDLYDPARHEVVCGLMSRAARAALVLVSNPDLWGGENGAGTIRLFAETEIVMTWLSLEGNEAFYSKYQDYGRGKAKLAHANMKAMIEAMGAETPDLLKESTAKLGASLGGDWGTELIDVDIAGTFSGKTVRDMAREAGLADLYRNVYQQSSAVTHGEWWTIEDQALQRCLNPLHKFHQIPSFNAQPSFGAEMGPMLVGKLEGLLGQAVGILFPARPG
jgi:Family of unknown function (DUF5677)